MASLKQLASQGVVKKTDLYRIRPQDLKVEAGFNLRLEGQELEDHITSIFTSIMNGGDVPPIEVRVDEDDNIIVIDGHCRRRAYLKAIEAGCSIEWIDVLQFKGNDADRVAKMITSGQGKPLSPLETALGYKRLCKFGWDLDRIAKTHGRTKSHVEQLVVLAHANSDVQQLVAEGAVSAHTAIEVVRKHGEKAGAYLKDQLDTARSRGKSKVTSATIQGRALPRKIIASVVTSIDNFTARLDHRTLTAIAELHTLDPDEIKDRTIEIDAQALLEIMNANTALTEARAKQTAKTTGIKQPTKQTEPKDGAPETQHD